MREGDVVGDGEGEERTVFCVLPSGLFVGTDLVTYSPQNVEIVRAATDEEHEETLRRASQNASFRSLACEHLVDLLTAQERHLETLCLAFPNLTWSENEGPLAMFHGGPVRVIRWGCDERWEARWMPPDSFSVVAIGATPVTAVRGIREQIEGMAAWAREFL